MSGRDVELLVTPLAILAVKGDEVVGAVRLGKRPEEAVRRYRELVERGRMGPEVAKFVEELASRYKLTTRNPSLMKAVKEGLGIGVEVLSPRPPTVHPEEALAKGGVVEDVEMAREMLKESMSILTVEKLREEMEGIDKIIINAISAYDELTEIINIMYERLREWYGLHFPELERIVKKYTLYSRLVAEIGEREGFTLEALRKGGIDERTARKISEIAGTSIGISFDERDLDVVVSFAEHLVSTIKERDLLEKYIEETLREYAPNMTALLGPKLTGKLISKAGGLRRLAMLPASTVQLLGAEKALFRALRKGGKPPKHGIIFQHPAVNKAPKKLRGKIARALASKISIAARIDVFGTENVGKKLREGFEAKVKEIYKKYSAVKQQEKKGRRRRR